MKNKKPKKFKFLRKLTYLIPVAAIVFFIVGTGWIPILNVHFMEGNLFFDSTSNIQENFKTPDVILVENDWEMRKEGAPEKDDILLKFGMKSLKSFPVYLTEMNIGYKGYGLRSRNLELYEIMEDGDEKHIGDFVCTSGCNEEGETIMNDKERFVEGIFSLDLKKGVRVIEEKGIRSFVIKGEIAIFNEVNAGSNAARGLVWIPRDGVQVSSSKKGENTAVKGWINAFNNANKWNIYTEIKKFDDYQD